MTNLTYSAFASIRQNTEPSTRDEEISSSVSGDPVEDPLLKRVMNEERKASQQNWLHPNDYFGSIRSVQPKSVAEQMGLQDCDRLIQFGQIDSTSFQGLRQLAEYFESSRGKVIPIVVGRNIGDHYEVFRIEGMIPTDPSERLGWVSIVCVNCRIHFIPR